MSRRPAEAVTYTEHARRKTVTAMDVVFALKKNGRTLYGFGGPTGSWGGHKRTEEEKENEECGRAGFRGNEDRRRMRRRVAKQKTLEGYIIQSHTRHSIQTDDKQTKTHTLYTRTELTDMYTQCVYFAYL